MHSIRFRNLKFTETLLIQNVVTAVEENLAVISCFVFNTIFHIKRKIPHILSLCCNSVCTIPALALFEAKLYCKTLLFFLQTVKFKAQTGLLLFGQRKYIQFKTWKM